MKLKIHWTRTKIISLVGAILILGLAGWLLWRNGYVGADTYMADTYMKYFGLEPGFGQTGSSQATIIVPPSGQTGGSGQGSGQNGSTTQTDPATIQNQGTNQLVTIKASGSVQYNAQSIVFLEVPTSSVALNLSYELGSGYGMSPATLKTRISINTYNKTFFADPNASPLGPPDKTRDVVASPVGQDGSFKIEATISKDALISATKGYMNHRLVFAVEGNCAEKVEIEMFNSGSINSTEDVPSDITIPVNAITSPINVKYNCQEAKIGRIGRGWDDATIKTTGEVKCSTPPGVQPSKVPSPTPFSFTDGDYNGLYSTVAGFQLIPTIFEGPKADGSYKPDRLDCSISGQAIVTQKSTNRKVLDKHFEKTFGLRPTKGEVILILVNIDEGDFSL